MESYISLSMNLPGMAYTMLHDMVLHGIVYNMVHVMVDKVLHVMVDKVLHSMAYV